MLFDKAKRRMTLGEKTLLAFFTTVFVGGMVVGAPADPDCVDCRKFETWNLGLAPHVPNREERLPLIIQQLGKSDADFICLQEVWKEKHVRAIVDELGSKFNYQYSALHSAAGVFSKPVHEEIDYFFGLKDNACHLMEAVTFAKDLLDCGKKQGCPMTHASTAERNACLRKCKEVMMARSESCVSCMYHNSYHSAEDSLRWCSMSTDVDNRQNTHGMVILSRQPIKGVSYHDFFQNNRSSVPRGYINATLDNGMVAVCTEHSYDVPWYFEFDLDYGSYHEQIKHEIKALTGTFVNEDIVLLGSLQMGPKNKTTGLEGRFAKNYQMYLDRGFESPYADQNGQCTACRDENPYQRFFNEDMDHVMIKGKSLTSRGAPKRVYDQAVNNQTLSYRYGISVEVCKT